MKRRLRLELISFLLGLLDRLDAFHNEPCNAYGGSGADQVRLCSKRRWHIDSHTYEFVAR